MVEKVVIYGAGGSARETAWLVGSFGQGKKMYELCCFIDDIEGGEGKFVNEVPVLTLQGAKERFPNAKMVVSVGDPRAREIMVERAESLGYEFISVVHPDLSSSRFVSIGKGTIVCTGCIITTNVVLGDHVQVNIACSISHDSILDDFATLAPGVHISGWVHVGRGVTIGTGAVVINGSKERRITIGDHSTVGAGACVTGDVEPGSKVAGVPARKIGKD